MTVFFMILLSVFIGFNYLLIQKENADIGTRELELDVTAKNQLIGNQIKEIDDWERRASDLYEQISALREQHAANAQTIASYEKTAAEREELLSRREDLINKLKQGLDVELVGQQSREWIEFINNGEYDKAHARFNKAIDSAYSTMILSEFRTYYAKHIAMIEIKSLDVMTRGIPESNENDLIIAAVVDIVTPRSLELFYDTLDERRRAAQAVAEANARIAALEAAEAERAARLLKEKEELNKLNNSKNDESDESDESDSEKTLEVSAMPVIKTIGVDSDGDGEDGAGDAGDTADTTDATEATEATDATGVIGATDAAGAVEDAGDSAGNHSSEGYNGTNGEGGAAGGAEGAGDAGGGGEVKGADDANGAGKDDGSETGTDKSGSAVSPESSAAIEEEPIEEEKIDPFDKSLFTTATAVLKEMGEYEAVYIDAMDDSIFKTGENQLFFLLNYKKEANDWEIVKITQKL